MSTTDRPQEHAVEDISIDDDLLQLGGGPGAAPDPHWVWCLVRSENDPPRQVWIRYPVEEVPCDAMSVRAAHAPRAGDDGVIVRGETIVAAVRTTSAPSNLNSFLRHVGDVATERREIFRAIKRGLEARDHDAVIKYARALVGG